jgi:hypothetical protein
VATRPLLLADQLIIQAAKFTIIVTPILLLFSYVSLHFLNESCFPGNLRERYGFPDSPMRTTCSKFRGWMNLRLLPVKCYAHCALGIMLKLMLRRVKSWTSYGTISPLYDLFYVKVNRRMFYGTTMSTCMFQLQINLMNFDEIWYLGFEVLTSVVMKISIFWDIAPCSPLKVNRCFGGTCFLRIQGRPGVISQNIEIFIFGIHWKLAYFASFHSSIWCSGAVVDPCSEGARLNISADLRTILTELFVFFLFQKCIQNFSPEIWKEETTRTYT